VLRPSRRRATSLAEDQVEARDVFRPDSTDALATERLLGVDDRRAVGSDCRRLTLQRVRPAVGPIREPNVRPRTEVAVLDRVLYSEQGQFSLLAVSANDLSLRLFAVADDDVVAEAFERKCIQLVLHRTSSMGDREHTAGNAWLEG